MPEEIIINNKYKLISELSTEPFGSYYSAEIIETDIPTYPPDLQKDKNNKKYLILLLNASASILARQNLIKIQDKVLITDDINNNSKIWPIIDIVDSGELISIVMPYLDGCSLASMVASLKKPLKLRSAIRLLYPLVKAISYEHNFGNFHGFINFSTIWVTKNRTKNNKLKLIGFDIFNIIFDKLEIKSSEFHDPKISSCISEDNQSAKITFSLASDYYSLLVITCTLLNGSIPSTKNYTFSPIKAINKKARKLLTANYYRDAYQDNQSLEDWFRAIYSTIKWPVLENCLAIVLMFSFISVLIYQYQPDIKLGLLFNYNNMISKYFGITKVNNKLFNNSDLVNLNNNQDISHEITPGPNQINTILDDKIISMVPDLDVENNLYSFTAANEYKNIISEAELSALTNPSANPSEIKNNTDLNQNNFNNLINNLSKESISQSAPVLTVSAEPIDPIYTRVNYSKLADSDGFVCDANGIACRERIVDLVSGPKMIKINFNNENAWVMQSPISRRDYYTYCYFVDDCKQKQEIVDNNILKCIFENICTDDANIWLNYPINNLAFSDLDKYKSWLNKVTNANQTNNFYQIMPDKFWPIIASKFKPDQNCIAINNNASDFIVFNKPEFVSINSLLAIRAPAKYITGEESYGEPQCQALLQTDGISGSGDQGGVLVRLIKKST